MGENVKYWVTDTTVAVDYGCRDLIWGIKYICTKKKTSVCKTSKEK